MTTTLHGKTLVVVGGSRGVGKGIAVAAARAGAKVAIVSRPSVTESAYPRADRTVADIRESGGIAVAVPCDIAVAADVRRMVEAVQDSFGRIDFMINNAVARDNGGSALSVSEADWDGIFAVNVKGAFLLTQAVAPGMIGAGFGHIVHLTGSGAHDCTLISPLFGASKAALERFVRGAALELRRHNVGLSCLDPGSVKTERATLARGPGYDWSGYVAPEEVGPVAIWMLTQDPGALAGQIVRRTEFEPPAWRR